MSEELAIIKDFVLDAVVKREQAAHINPLNRRAAKCFSQTDEDGITLEILRRLDCLEGGTYIEYGPGDGMENNTLILASLGWHGSWIGGQDLAWRYQPCKKMLFQKDWVTVDSIPIHIARARGHLNVSNVDVVSMDLDGNDIYFTEKILNLNIKPKLFIVEYNAKFIPPVRFQMDYNPDFQWNGTDWFGASLASYTEMFERHDYQLVCCNSHTGANAFYVRKDLMAAFNDVPTDIRDLYAGPRYHLMSWFGHRASFEVIETLFRD
jgi:hypothetical protein